MGDTPKITRAVWIGRRRYAPVHALQERLVEARGAGTIGDVILLVEHEPVVTLGRSANPSNVLLSASALEARGVDRVETGRGGDVTYHGPGQLVGYPILDLQPDRCDVRRYVRQLAEVMILIARRHHVESGVVDGLIGIWVDAASPAAWGGEAYATDMKKLGAIGVRISRWITMHGFALNLAIDPAQFGVIVPCGIADHGVTSIVALTGRAPEVREVAMRAHEELAEGLGIEVSAVEDLSGAPDLEGALLR